MTLTPVQSLSQLRSHNHSVSYLQSSKSSDLSLTLLIFTVKSIARVLPEEVEHRLGRAHPQRRLLLGTRGPLPESPRRGHLRLLLDDPQLRTVGVNRKPDNRRWQLCRCQPCRRSSPLLHRELFAKAGNDFSGVSIAPLPDVPLSVQASDSP